MHDCQGTGILQGLSPAAPGIIKEGYAVVEPGKEVKSLVSVKRYLADTTEKHDYESKNDKEHQTAGR